MNSAELSAEAGDARSALLKRYQLLPVTSSAPHAEADRIPVSIVSPKKRRVPAEMRINITGHRPSENDIFLDNSLASHQNRPLDNGQRSGSYHQPNREEDITAGPLGHLEKIGRFGQSYKNIVKVEPASSAASIEKAAAARKTPGYLDSLLAKAKHESILHSRAAAFEQQQAERVGKNLSHVSSDHLKSISIQEARSAYKRRDLQRFKNNRRGLSCTIERRRVVVAEDAHTAVATKKQVNLFRQKLLRRLVEKNDPFSGDFLKVVTEDTAQQFIKDFNGCILTTDTVLSLIGGHAVNIKLLDAPIESSSARPTRNAEIAAIVAERRSNKQPAYDFIQKRLPPPLIGSNPPSRLASRAGSAAAAADERPTTRSARRPATAAAQKSEEGEQARQRGKVLGGGFVVASTGSATYSPTNPKGPLTISGLTEEQEDERRKDSAVVMIMKSQLLAEGKLPSSFPERVLTTDQLIKLGSKETTFDDIERSIKWREKTVNRTNSGSFQVGVGNIERVRLTDANPPPIALPTDDRYTITQRQTTRN